METGILYYSLLNYFYCNRAVGYIPGVVLYPIVTWVLLTLTIAFWAVIAVYPSFTSYCDHCVYMLYVLVSL